MKKIHYAWWMLAACCLMICGGMGVFRYTGGLFFQPVAADFGVGMTVMGSLQTIQGVAGILSVPFVAKALSGKNIGKVIALVTFIHCLAIGSLYFSNSIIHWYIANAIAGFCGSFIYMTPTPLLLARWFRKKQGTVIGFAMLFTGLSGAVATKIMSSVILSSGWRVAILANACATAVLMIPVALFIVKSDPADMGLLPYGATEEDMAAEREKALAKAAAAASGVKEAFFDSRATRDMFILVMTALVLMGFGSAYTPFFPSFAVECGFTQAQGANLASCLMIGTALWKLVVGVINDKIGARKSTFVALGIGAVGFMLVIFGKMNISVLYAAGVICGVQQALGALQPPLIAKDIFGMRLFSKYLAYISAISTVVGAAGAGIIGAVYDSTGSYIPGFWMGIGVIVLAAIAMLIALNYKTKHSYNPE